MVNSILNFLTLKSSEFVIFFVERNIQKKSDFIPYTKALLILSLSVTHLLTIFSLRVEFNHTVVFLEHTL
jgi:hypothetical protein